MSSLVLICVLPTSLLNKIITLSPCKCLLLHILCVCVRSLSCSTLLQHMDCSPPGSSVHGIFQARILEWVDISISRGSSRHRDQTHISFLAGGFFNTEPPGKPNTIQLHTSGKNIFCSSLLLFTVAL